MRALAPGHCYHCVILRPFHPAPPLSSLLPHVLPSFHTAQTKLIPPLLIVRERARPDRRVQDTGRAEVATGGAPGPQTEPGTSLPPAAAWPRLRLGSRRLSAWGAGAAGSRTGRRESREVSGSSARLLARRSPPSPTPVRLCLRHPSPLGNYKAKERKMQLARARAPRRGCSQSALLAPLSRARVPL